ncbi:MAG: hypothetical protein COB36_10175 [Alphaproteobacteria bacterium]|nr:MAG: hypothetical protein COB36_10175 [Alphaproteobacteria bacterium]
MENSFGDLVIRALEDVRYLADDQNYDTVNVSRAKLHPLWRAVQDAAFQALFENRSGLCPGTIRNQLRHQMINDSRKLCAAHARRYGVALGLTDEQIIEDLPKIVSDSLTHDIDQDPEAFVAKAQAIQQKVRFIEDERFDVEEYQKHLAQH